MSGDLDLTHCYAGGDPVCDNSAEIQAFKAYVAADHAISPSVDALRQWVPDTTTNASQGRRIPMRGMRRSLRPTTKTPT
jgi:hypothetical protein